MGILIDARVIPKRKVYMIIFSLAVTLVEAFIATHIIKDVDKLSAVLFMDAFSQWFLDATITSYMV